MIKFLLHIILPKDMKLEELKNYIPYNIYEELAKKGFEELRPSQVKSIKTGLFEDKNLLVCTSTASGKTLVGELGILNSVKNKKLKGVYIVPLKALASEKYRYFKETYPDLKTGIGSGDVDSTDTYLNECDVVILTSEKFDSLIRHKAPWIGKTGCLVVDEIHLLNDMSRGPTLEVVLTIMKKKKPDLQIIGLSATIGNSKELAEWLEAELVEDKWRPVNLKKGIYFEGDVEFYSKIYK